MKRLSFNFSFLLLFIVLLTLAVMGCPSSTNEPDDPETQSVATATETGSGQEADGPVINDPVNIEQESDPETEAFLEEHIGTENDLTQEEVEDLAGYGSIVFPGAELIVEESTHQVSINDSEIYNLKFGIEAPVDEVSEWFRENSESGTVESNRMLGNGMHVNNFQYDSPDGRWGRSVTVKGGPGERQCLTSVYIYFMAPVPEEETDE